MFNLFTPKLTKADQCHKKQYYDLESVQVKLGIFPEQIDKAWSKRKKDKPVYLTTTLGQKWFISNYD